MTCKDCVHYEVCVVIENSVDKERNFYGEFGCEDFKNKSDFVEAIRCCECKYSKAVGDIGCYCQNRKTPWFNDEYEVYMNLDDFCSYGERKDTE